MAADYDLLRGSREDFRLFAKGYIQRRLAEDKRDAINELSAYLGDWLLQRNLHRGYLLSHHSLKGKKILKRLREVEKVLGRMDRR